MFKLLEVSGQRGGSDAFGRRAAKNIGIRTDMLDKHLLKLAPLMGSWAGLDLTLLNSIGSECAWTG